MNFRIINKLLFNTIPTETGKCILRSPDGNDWFSYKGQIIWDDSRRGTITHDGHKWRNIGRSITITTTSYINVPNDVPIPESIAKKGAGAKLITMITLTGNYSKGKFTGITYNYDRNIGKTFGLDVMQGKEISGLPNTARGPGTWAAATNGNALDINAHVTTPDIETFGLRILGSNVDVNQELSITLKNGELNIDITHGTYPSVNLTINGTAAYSALNWYNYQQQSFIQSHATRFWTAAAPIWAIAPDFMIQMAQRQARAQNDYIQLNKLYQNNNKVGTVKLNDFPLPQ